MCEETHMETGLAGLPGMKVCRWLDSVGTNRYRRDPEDHPKRGRPDCFTGGVP